LTDPLNKHSQDRSVQPGRIIVGVGSALVDMLIYESDEFISRLVTDKGGMTLVDGEFAASTLSATSQKPSVVPGGSACNTLVGVGRLGGGARFVGKRGNDKQGNLLQAGLSEAGVKPSLLNSTTSTGQVLSIITPDAQRTMFTYLGASAELHPDEITADLFEGAGIVHIEGYLLFNQELIKAVMLRAKEAAALVSLDLASFTVVEQSKACLDQLVEDFVDILIANEDEAATFTGCRDDFDALRALSEKVDIASLKVGVRGSYIARSGEVVRVAPMGTGTAVDTTGAGDLWASGFLYGLVNDLPLEQCGALASACGFEVCQVVGAVIPDEGWERIRPLVR